MSSARIKTSLTARLGLFLLIQLPWTQPAPTPDQMNRSLFRWKRNSFEELSHRGQYDDGEAQCVNYSNDFGWTKIHWASWCGHDERVQMLINKGFDVNVRTEFGDTPLIVASCNDHLAIVRMLIDANADVNIKDEMGFTAIYVAARDGHDKVVELLIKRGASIEIKDNDGWAPRDIAEKEGHTKIVNLLDACGIRNRHEGI